MIDGELLAVAWALSVPIYLPMLVEELSAIWKKREIEKELSAIWKKREKDWKKREKEMGLHD